MNKPLSIVIVAIAIASGFYLHSCQQKGKANTSSYRPASSADSPRILAPDSQSFIDQKVFISSVHGTSIPYAIMLPPAYSANPEGR